MFRDVVIRSSDCTSSASALPFVGQGFSASVARYASYLQYCHRESLQQFTVGKYYRITVVKHAQLYSNLLGYDGHIWYGDARVVHLGWTFADFLPWIVWCLTRWRERFFDTYHALLFCVSRIESDDQITAASSPPAAVPSDTNSCKLLSYSMLDISLRSCTSKL